MNYSFIKLRNENEKSMSAADLDDKALLVAGSMWLKQQQLLLSFASNKW